MKKTIFLSLAAIIFLISHQSSFASMQTKTQTKVDKTNEGYQFTINVGRGWNLIPFPGATFEMIPIQDLDSFIRARYVYLPVSNKYVEFYGGFNNTELAEFQISRDYLNLGAAWFYATENREITYMTNSNVLVTDFLPGKLYKGWNLMTIPPQFFDKSYGWGNCDIEKIYTWDEVGQKWSAWPMDRDPKLGKFLEEASEGDFIGYGVAIKVRDNCLAVSKIEGQGGTIAPPSIPN